MAYVFGMCEDCGKQKKDCKCGEEDEREINNTKSGD